MESFLVSASTVAIAEIGAGSGGAFLLVLGVFLGSMLWWALLVTLVGGLREIVSATWLGSIDLATGLVLIATGLIIGARGGTVSSALRQHVAS